MENIALTACAAMVGLLNNIRKLFAETNICFKFAYAI